MSSQSLSLWNLVGLHAVCRSHRVQRTRLYVAWKTSSSYSSFGLPPHRLHGGRMCANFLILRFPRQNGSSSSSTGVNPASGAALPACVLAALPSPSFLLLRNSTLSAATSVT